MNGLPLHSRSVKGGFTLRKKNGYSLIEVIVASSIFLSAVAIFIPIVSKLQIEQHILSERSTAAHQLHEELQQYIWVNASAVPAGYRKDVNSNTIEFDFEEENDYIKGCAAWQNAKQTKEFICLYGLPNK